MEIKAVIFDMDGLMLDTEKLLVKYWCEAANKLGFPMERRHALALRSFSRKFAIPQLKEWFGEGLRLYGYTRSACKADEGIYRCTRHREKAGA